MLAKKTSKNQLTLPKEIVGNFPGIDLFDAVIEDHRIVLKPVKAIPLNTSLEGLREKIRKLGIDENDVAEAVKGARN
ncbi:MAG: AbrB/MazE/SpoVT family DNA-binding domain-containing protein [Deltaproteobacteria bacterium]|nr:AbrB/MazE/SpoVT family DNA-binding domain-containing protein [Deltaproteobacteria bacterium]